MNFNNACKPKSKNNNLLKHRKENTRNLKMRLNSMKKQTHFWPIVAVVGKSFRRSGIPLISMIGAIPACFSSGFGVLEKILKKTSKWPDYPDFILISANPVYPEGWLPTPDHLCII
jgi:hypothetical protein